MNTDFGSGDFSIGSLREEPRVFRSKFDELYAGNYTGEAAKGPVPSRAWRQFK